MTPDEHRQIQRLIYECGEVERDAARLRQFIPNVWPFCWIVRLLAWVERDTAAERAGLRRLMEEEGNDEHSNP